MNKTFTFKTSIYAGDLIYTLPGIREACRKSDTKAEIYLWLDRYWKQPYDGAHHPYPTPLTQHVYEMLKPLMEAQDYIAGFHIWKGEQIACDLDELRDNAITSMPYGSITRWPMHVWPDMQCDVSEPWIYDGYSGYWPHPHPDTFGKIIVNRTSRYRNEGIHYWFLKEHQDKVIFAGLPEEHVEFCKQWELDIPLLNNITDFMELAYAIKSCRFFLGNQSMCFAIAEAMKIPRILEICPYAPNVIPCGPNGYDFYHQFALDFLFKDLISKL
jgi:hypothetical protein